MKSLIIALQLCVAAGFSSHVQDAHAKDPVKTVYHMSEGIPQASRGLNNIRNHLAADPSA